MSAEESPTKFVVFLNDKPYRYDFHDSREEAEELLPQQSKCEVREVAAGELLCPGCLKNKLLFVHQVVGGWMGCPECGKVGMGWPP